MIQGFFFLTRVFRNVEEDDSNHNIGIPTQKGAMLCDLMIFPLISHPTQS